MPFPLSALVPRRVPSGRHPLPRRRPDGRPGRRPGAGRIDAALLALLALAAVAAPTPAAAQEEGIAVGETPDPVVLETLDGEPVDLADVVGTRPVLVQFWATWCPICQALHPRMAAAHEAYGDDVEFLVIAVAVAQDRATIERHLQRRPVAGRLLWDTRGRATRAFEAPGTGYIALLDSRGKVVYTGTGVDQDIDGAIRRMLADEPARDR